MPLDLSTHSIASAWAVKIFGADLNPNGSIASIYTAPIHCTPSKGLSSGWTGTRRYADLMSAFASMVLCPNFTAWLAMHVNRGVWQRAVFWRNPLIHACPTRAGQISDKSPAIGVGFWNHTKWDTVYREWKRLEWERFNKTMKLKFVLYVFVYDVWVLH